MIVHHLLRASDSIISLQKEREQEGEAHTLWTLWMWIKNTHNYNDYSILQNVVLNNK